MATNATIVQRLNERIADLGGETKGRTISDCLGIINGLEKQEGGNEDEEGSTASAVSFLTSLDQGAISDYMIANKDAVMAAFNVDGSASAGAIGTALYDRLQGGDTVTVSMNDGGVLTIKGHFYEPSDDLPYWDMEIGYAVPADGTDKCFSAGSGKMVKGGSVLIHVTNGEITNSMEYDTVLCIYSYVLDITGVTFVDGDREFIVDISGLEYPYDSADPCIIDPNGADWTITVRSFHLPPADAEGTVRIDGVEASWSDVRSMIGA